MRNLILFVIRNHFALLFLLLEFFCFVLIIRNNDLQREKFLSSANELTASIDEKIDEVTQYFALPTVNRSLAEENALLRRMLGYNYMPNLEVKKLKMDTVSIQQYDYMFAKVISNTTARHKNYLTLNRGSIHGVEKNMAVIAPQGVVGIVDEVSEHFCTVVSLLNTNYRVSAKFAKSNYFGSCYWKGGNPRQANLGEIPYHVDVHEGDSIVTSGFSAIYPAGIPIGTVAKFSVSGEDNFYDIRINLAVDFSSIDYVYVISNLLRKEQLELENVTSND